MIRWLLTLLLALHSLASFAGASPEICGNGIDDDSSGGDLACPSPDADRDTYTAGVDDCDDANFNIFPGAFDTAGCSANQVRKCQSDGTYTSCVNLSSATATTFASDGLALYYLDPTRTADGNSGSYASPWNPLCISNTALSCYHTPIPGDIFVMLSGMYDHTWSDSGTTRMIYVNNKDGNGTNRIYFIMLPGASVVGQGVSPTEVLPIYFTESDFWTFVNVTVNSGYSNAGLTVDGDDCIVYGGDIHDIDGESDNNLAGWKFDTAHRLVLHNIKAYNNYERANPNGVNNSQVYVTQSDAFQAWAIMGYNTGTPYGHGFKNKHPYSGTNAGSVLRDSIFFNLGRSGVKLTDRNIEVKDVLLQEVATNSGLSIEYINDSDIKAAGTSVHNVTIINSPYFEFIPTGSVLANPAFTLYDNVVIDNAASYNSDGTEGFIRVCHYCADTTYGTVITSGALNQYNDCFYNSAGSAFFASIYGDVGSTMNGATYTSFANFQSAGFAVGSFSENPSLNSYQVAESANCAGKGIRLTGSTPPAPTTNNAMMLELL